MPRTVAGGHLAGWSIGTEPALCQTSLMALQPVVLPVMPYWCSRALVPQILESWGIVEVAQRKCGSINAPVHNAGIYFSKPFTHDTRDDLRAFHSAIAGPLIAWSTSRRHKHANSSLLKKER